MGRVSLTIPYVRQTASGFYWEPSRKVRGLGFNPEALGADMAKAEARARALNAQVEATLKSEQPPAAPVEGTVSWFAAQYQASRTWAKLRPKTQRGYLQCLKLIEAWAGSSRVEVVTRRAVKAWQERIEEKTPAYAAAILRVLRVLMHFARDKGAKVDNFDKLDLHTAGGDAEPWEDYEITAYCDQARLMGRQSMALALMFGVCLGQREGDIIRLARGQYRGGEIDLRQAKTARRIAVPVLPELAAEIARAPLAGTIFVVSETTGAGYKEDNFRHIHRDICRAAGIDDARKFMHLRHTAAQRLGDAGCSDELIRSVTGHLSRSVVGRYVRPNSTMAKAAIDTIKRNRKSTSTENV